MDVGTFDMKLDDKRLFFASVFQLNYLWSGIIRSFLSMDAPALELLRCCIIQFSKATSVGFVAYSHDQ